MGDYVRAFAQDSGYYVVYRNGVRVSDHTTERKAHSVAVNLVIEFPDDEIYYIHEYRVNVLRTNLSFAQVLPIPETNFKGFLTNDALDASATFQITVEPVNGTLQTFLDGSFIYTPNLDFVGQDEFTYEVTDSGGTSTAKVFITVTP